LAFTRLRSGEVFRLANCLSPQWPVNRRRRNSSTGPHGIVHHAVPVQGLQQLEAIAIQVMLATNPVKILAACLSPTRPLISRTSLPWRRSSVLMSGDLNAKHVEWNSRLITKRGRLAWLCW
jgi:hypothetical protein